MPGVIEQLQEPLLDKPPATSTAAQQGAAQAAAAAAGGGAGASMTRDRALERIAELKSDPKWIEKYLGGDVKAQSEFKEVNRVAYSPEVNPTPKGADLGSRISHWMQYGLPSPDSPAGQELATYLAGTKTITPELRQQVEARRSVLLSDKGFVDKYLSGDGDAKRVMSTISIMLGAKVEKAAA